MARKKLVQAKESGFSPASKNSKVDDVQKLWEERILRAKKYKEEEWEKQFRVKLSRDYFAGKQNPGWPQDEWITINEIYSHLMAELPSLYSVDPYFYVKVKRSYSPNPLDIALFEQRAKIRQSYLNYLKGELRLKPKARLGIQDAEFAFGVLKVHFYADSHKNPDYGNDLKSEEGKKLYGDDGEPLKEPEYIPVNERYCVSRVHPDDFLWSADAGPLEDKWCWVAERVRMTKEQAENDKRLHQKTLESLQPGDSDSEDDKKKNKDRSKQDETYVFWEIYDLEAKKWLIIAEGAKKPLMEPEELPKGVDKHPYTILRFTLQDKTPYPIPPVSQMLDPQKEYCMARSRYLTHRKRFNRKYEVFMNGLTDETEVDKLESGEDGTILRKQTNGQVVTPIQDAPLDQNGWTEIMALKNDIIGMSGRSGESRGLADADSATQADILEKRLQIREGDKLSLVTEWLMEVAEKLDKLVQANITRDEAVKIVGPQGEFWEMVRTDDYEAIKGEFEYGITIGSTSPQLPQLERAQFIALLSLFAKFPQLLLNRHLMKRVMEMHNFDDEVVIEELYELAQKMMNGKIPMPGQPGGEQPGAGVAGSALGVLGGLMNGGGAAARDGFG